MIDDVVLRIAFAAGSAILFTVLLQRRNYRLAACSAVLAAAWLAASPRLLEWIEHLGSDSFSEAQNFDFFEAFDFISSLRQILAPALALRNAVPALAMLLVSIGLTVSVSRTRPGASALRSRPALGAAIALIAGIPVLQLLPAVGEFRWNSEYYRTISANFHGPHTTDVQLVGESSDMKVVVYIGESTSALNMGIYGYPRSTTPQLDDFRRRHADSMFVYQNVFSTHVHTAPSLLEALSVSVDGAEDILPISHRKRVSLVDLLHRAGVETRLISNQGRAGAWNNLASTVVFRKVGSKEFSFNSRWLGELEHRARRPLDHVFLPDALERSGSLEQPGPEVVFLHSYAGHGPYLRNIAETFHEPVDDFFSGLPAVAVAESGNGNPGRVLELIEQYDATIRYVDHVLAGVMRQVSATPLPTAFVYFSDHGDAVYAGIRHDSARFRHEMARVPFLVFFNDAAASQYPRLLQEFRETSLGERTSTLAQFPATLLSLFGLGVENGRFRGIGIDEPAALPPILTRETSKGYTYIRLSGLADATSQAPQVQDAADAFSALYRTVHDRSGVGPRVCAERATTLSDILRSVLVADCVRLEIDTIAAPSEVGEPALMTANGLDLGVLGAIANGYRRSIWISGSALASASDCLVFQNRWANDSRLRTGVELLSIPADADWGSQDYRNCIESLRSAGLRIGLEIPSGIASRCAVELRDGNSGTACRRLSDLLDEVVTYGLFTDLAFEYADASAVLRTATDRALALNAHGLSIQVIEAADVSPFRTLAVEPIVDAAEF